MRRNCEICLGKRNKHLYTQQFLVPGEKEDSHYEYDVVACEKCGFVYATNIMSRAELSDFYKNNLKYVYKSDRGNIPDYAKWLHAKSYYFVDTNLAKIVTKFDKKKLSILDIGCGAGYLLNCFKEKGYKKLQGLDPAPDCRVTARDLYNIEIESSTLEEYHTNQKFDLIILGSVLEHMSNIDEVVERIKDLLKEGGFLYICVPDGDNMGAVLSEPFLEFSLEHINYFTRGSMSNLLCSRGFSNVGFESLLVEGYGGYALNALWQMVGTNKKTKFDEVGEAKITQYIESSEIKLARIAEQIDAIIGSQRKIYVWGVGSLASRLLTSTNLKNAKIESFIDSNPSQQGKVIVGKRIIPPVELTDKEATVLVTSYIHGAAIKKDLIEKYNHRGEIITLA